MPFIDVRVNPKKHHLVAVCIQSRMTALSREYKLEVVVLPSGGHSHAFVGMVTDILKHASFIKAYFRTYDYKHMNLIARVYGKTRPVL